MNKLTEAELQFITDMGMHTQGYGFSRIAGQIIAALIISDAPLNTADLMSLLEISKGSVSTNIRFLEMLQLVERRALPGKRLNYFVMRTNPYDSLLELKIKQHEEAKKIITEAKASIKNSKAQEKITELERFNTLYDESVKKLLLELKSER